MGVVLISYTDTSYYENIFYIQYRYILSHSSHYFVASFHCCCSASRAALMPYSESDDNVILLCINLILTYYDVLEADFMVVLNSPCVALSPFESIFPKYSKCFYLGLYCNLKLCASLNPPFPFMSMAFFNSLFF